MDDLVVLEAPSLPRIGPMSLEAIDKVLALEKIVLGVPQLAIFTDHVIHGGMYARTAFVPAGNTFTGALVEPPTMLIVFGEVLVFIGEDEPLHLSGCNVVPASGGRKQAFETKSDVYLIAVCISDAKTVPDAEHHFTKDYDLLASHRDDAINRITITGE